MDTGKYILDVYIDPFLPHTYESTKATHQVIWTYVLRHSTPKYIYQGAHSKSFLRRYFVLPVEREELDTQLTQ